MNDILQNIVCVLFRKLRIFGLKGSGYPPSKYEAKKDILTETVRVIRRISGVFIRPYEISSLKMCPRKPHAVLIRSVFIGFNFGSLFPKSVSGKPTLTIQNLLI